MVGTLVMAPKSVTFRRHDHCVMSLCGNMGLDTTCTYNHFSVAFFKKDCTG